MTNDYLDFDLDAETEAMLEQLKWTPEDQAVLDEANATQIDFDVPQAATDAAPEPQKQPQSVPEGPASSTHTPPTKTRGNGITAPVTLRLPLVLLDWLRVEAKRRGMPYQRLMVRLLSQARNDSLQRA